MGGSQNIGEASDNPVEINVTAMVDVIFCLCIFFMCSFHFKQVEGKIDTWLPKYGNQPGTPDDKIHLEEIRVFMRWDADRNATTLKVGNTLVSSDDEMAAAIRARKDDYAKTGKTEVPVIIDAMDPVPWHEVVHIVDQCKHEKLSPITFAEPMQYQVRPTR